MTPKANMYLGQQRLFLGSERDLVIPEPYCKVFTDGAYVTRGFERNLMILGESVFQEFYQKIVALNIADPLSRMLLRLIIGNASRLEMDTTGKVLIPEELRLVAGLEEEVVLVGQGNYIEIWAPVSWEEQTTKLLDTKANAERFAHLDLALQ